MTWTITAEFLQRIAKLHEKHAGSIAIDKPLPAELEKELLSYKKFIAVAVGMPKLQLCSAVPGSPELRSYCIRDIDHADPNVCKVTTKHPVLHDPLLTLFTILQYDERREIYGLQNLMDEIERLIRTNAEDKERISPIVARNLSELALTGELERQLELYQPRLFEPFYRPNPRAGQKLLLDSLSRMMKIGNHMERMPIANLGEPTARKFYYPADEKRAEETVEQMRRSEANLDKFWQEVDKIVLIRAQKYAKGRTLHVLWPGLMRGLVISRGQNHGRSHHQRERYPLRTRLTRW
jgi:hypothetical protein